MSGCLLCEFSSQVDQQAGVCNVLLIRGMLHEVF